MKSLYPSLILLLGLCSASAQTNLPNLGLTTLPFNYPHYENLMNGNLGIIDNIFPSTTCGGDGIHSLTYNAGTKKFGCTTTPGGGNIGGSLMNVNIIPRVTGVNTLGNGSLTDDGAGNLTLNGCFVIFESSGDTTSCADNVVGGKTAIFDSDSDGSAWNQTWTATNSTPLNFMAMIPDNTGDFTFGLRAPSTGSLIAGLKFNADGSISEPAGDSGAAILNSYAACETASAPTTLATGATTTDTGLNCLPANSIIDAVVGRVTTTITAACTGWELGDAATPARFSSNNVTLVSGTTTDAAHIGTFNNTGIASATTGTWQATAAKVRITCAGGNPGAGAVRVVVFYHTAIPPTI